MQRRLMLGCGLLLLLARVAPATSFIVPTDDELIAKADAIAVGTIEGSFVREIGTTIETVHEIRIERVIKGTGMRGGDLARIVEPGGVGGDRGVLVVGTARYRQGERVLVFLDAGSGEWRTVDLALGKFRFVTSTAGERLLVRDLEDVVGWDHAGRVHREKVRREAGFLQFIEERVKGRRPVASYVVEASEVTVPSAEEEDLRAKSSSITANAAPFPAETYVDWVASTPPRWPNISAGVTFYKRSGYNIPGASDGGVSVIRGGLAAWTNECASIINLTYAGERNTASANHDGINVVEFNDPQQRISGSWTGSGTVAITFISFAGNHAFNNRSWLNITSSDVVFQDGYPATNSSFPSAMTHELGHAIGWRHSNQDYATGGACNSSTQECTSAAIMNSSVSANYGYVLQPFDVHAAESVYPGGSCGPVCTPPSISSSPQSSTIDRGSAVTLAVIASGTTPLTYQWYVGPAGSTSSPISGATSSSLRVTPNSTTSYWVRVSNACGVANSATATVTVRTVPANRARGDFDGDGTTDIAVFRPSTGEWLIRGVGIIAWGQNGDQPAAADYNGDGVTDIGVFRPANGNWYIRGQGSAVQWGGAGDIAVPRDYNGDGRDDIAVFRPSTGQWFVRGVGGAVSWGGTGDQPAPADYDGDGADDIAIFRPSTGTWYIRGIESPTWGGGGDRAVPADYDRDGRDDVTVFRPPTGFWYIRGLGSPQWGQAGDEPVPGDYDGDGLADLAVFRPANGTWYVRDVMTVVWGQSGDIPVSD